MKLQVGLVSQSSGWEQLLAAEGVPHAVVALEQPEAECSVLIVNRALHEHEKPAVQRYLHEGGAILARADDVDRVCGTNSRRERIDFLLTEGDDIFPDVHLADLGTIGAIPREANCLRTQENVFAAFVGELGGGHAVLLPFDAAAMMGDGRFAHKNFYADRERLPAERVSLVEKGEVARLVHHALKYLHHVRGLPYVHLWYYPDGKRSLFAFRIDSDKGSRREVDTLAHLAVENSIGMSWFLDVKSHEPWLHHFAFLAGQEIGVHCYEHMTYSSFEENHKNIAKAKRKLEQVGISAPGFAAPFGMWNPALARAVDKSVFEYSSEFSYAYDTFPLYPSSGDEVFLTPQIPIHPICIGSLERVGYSESQMEAYFRMVIDRKLRRDEPLIFYHHPTHQHWDVVRFIFTSIQEQRIENVTMLEFARWWLKRLKCRSVFTAENSTLRRAETTAHDDSVWLRIIMPGRRVKVVPSAPLIDLGNIEWDEPRQPLSAPADIRRIREFDPRGSLGDVFASLARRFSGRKV